MPAPRWTLVLQFLYQQGGLLEVEHSATTSSEAEEALYSGLNEAIGFGDKVDHSKTEESVKYLRDMDLINWDSNKGTAMIRLKKEGFNIAHEREMVNKQDTTNRMLIVVTVGLFLAAIIQALASYYSVAPSYRWSMTVGTMMTVGISVLLLHQAYHAEFI